MPKKRRSGSTIRLEFFGDLRFANVLDWLTVLVLSLLLFISTYQIGGVRAETQLLTVWLTGILLVTHCLWLWVSSLEDKAKFIGWPILFLPFLVYVIFSWWFLTPAPWNARSDAIIAIQAFIVLWVASNGLRMKNQQWFVIMLLGALCLIAALIAFNQYFRSEDWLPKLFNPLDGGTYRLRQSLLYSGNGSGFFNSPNSLAGFLLLAFFPAVVAALSNHLSAILRVLSFYLAIMIAAALIMTMNREAMVLLFVGSLVTPWFVGYKPGRALKWSFVFLLISSLSILALLIYSTRFRSLWTTDYGQQFGLERLPLWESAISMFKHQPVSGSGIGSYKELFNQYRPEGYSLDTLHPQNTYLELASELGVIGIILFIGALIWLALLSLKCWKAMPNQVAIDDMGKDRRRRRIMPTQKMFLSMGMLSLFFFSLHLVFEFHLSVPALLLWSSFFLSLIFKGLPEWEFSLDKPFRLPVYLILLVLIGCLLPITTQRGFVAEIYHSEGRRLAQEFSQNLNEHRLDRDHHDTRLSVLNLALSSNSQHGDAYAEYSLALIDRSFLEPTRRFELGQEAQGYAENAIELHPASACFQIALGEALFLQKQWSDAGLAYEKAIELAPNDSRAWYYYANWLNGESDRREDAINAVECALELEPDNEQMMELRRKILIP